MTDEGDSGDETATGAARRLVSGDHFSRSEVRLALRNHGLPLEALACPVTPPGLHYTLSHFDIPLLDPAAWRLELDGLVARPLTLDLPTLLARPAVEQVVTLECAGNGRMLMEPHTVSQPWAEEAVGTARWRGVPLASLLEEAGVGPEAVEIVFSGPDAGVQGGERQVFRRSLPLAIARQPDILLAYAMNGQPLPPQHGAPLRLVVPGWYGMASVKWLVAITAVAQPFQGYQQLRSYRYTQDAADPGEPVTLARVRSLMIPPGVPDFLARTRFVQAGEIEIHGRAWSGAGPIVRVDFSGDGGVSWQEAAVSPPESPYAWSSWGVRWRARPGRYTLLSRATDAAGRRQPLEASWNVQGMGNNAVQRVEAVVE